MGVDNLAISNSGGIDDLAFSSGSAADNVGVGQFAIAAAGGTLDNSTPIDINVSSTVFFPDSGNAKIVSAADETEQQFAFTGKGGLTLTGCTIDSGTYDFNIGDKIYIL